MDISHDLDGRFEFEQNRLADENLTRLQAQTANLACTQERKKKQRENGNESREAPGKDSSM
jgi:hypothetical protein